LRVIDALGNHNEGGPFMASSSRKKTTMAKLNREAAVRERRVRKRAKKEARKLAALAEPEQTSIGEPDEASNGQLEEATSDAPEQASNGQLERASTAHQGPGTNALGHDVP
jgi:hypothetical protein